MVMTLREQRWSRWSRWLGRFSARQVDLALALLVTLAGLILFAFAGIGGSTRAGFLFLQNVEQRSLDMRFAARGQRPHDDRIVIVGIDEKTLQNVGSFPLPRTSYAYLVNRLSAGGAVVIAFDALSLHRRVTLRKKRCPNCSASLVPLLPRKSPPRSNNSKPLAITTRCSPLLCNSPAGWFWGTCF